MKSLVELANMLFEELYLGMLPLKSSGELERLRLASWAELSRCWNGLILENTEEIVLRADKEAHGG